jgi:hypothetical protein
MHGHFLANVRQTQLKSSFEFSIYRCQVDHSLDIFNLVINHVLAIPQFCFILVTLEPHIYKKSLGLYNFYIFKI